MHVLWESCFKAQKPHLTYIFTIKSFIFANFVQKIDFEQLHLQKLDAVLAGFYFELCALRLLGESFSKAP